MNTFKLHAERYAPFALALLIVLVDRITKIEARQSLSFYFGISVIPGYLRLVHTENPGAAFSFLSESNPIFRTVVLIGVSTLVLILVVLALWRRHPSFSSSISRISLGLILGGAMGNLYDRLVHGTVTDFIEVYHGGWSFPVFNVADSAITVGATLLLIENLFLNRK